MREIALALIAAGIAVGLLALVALPLLPTGLSPLRNPVSQYGISSYRLGYRIQTIAYAVAGLGAAIGISALSNLEVVVGLCGLFALARLAISWFPMDVPGSTRSQTGRRHGLLAIGAFAAVGLAGRPAVPGPWSGTPPWGDRPRQRLAGPFDADLPSGDDRRRANPGRIFRVG